MKNNIIKLFEKNFGLKPDLFYCSPGRVCIIGEHSDYHQGYVMPAAINLEITWAVKKNGKKIRGYADKFDEVGEFDVIGSKRSSVEWLQYFQGVVAALQKRGMKFGGVDFAISSTIPIGSGLSSSSSLVTGFTYILNDIYELNLNSIEIAQVACEAEWWYGTNGGIMDQFCISNGKENFAVLLDARSLKYELIKIPKNIEIVVFETTVRHKQKDSPFDLRKAQAKKVIGIANKKYPKKKIEALRDLTLKELEELKPLLIEKYGKKEGDIFYRRAKHPITENVRVMKMKAAFAKKDFTAIGEILAEGHNSLRDDYEVSCKELDKAVEIAHTHKELIGARMVGGGYGGCTINLVKYGHGQHLAGHLEEEFRKATGIKGNAYICNTSDGVRKTN